MGTSSKEHIKVKEPLKNYNHYWIAISYLVYNDLIRNNECRNRNRYGNSSKVKSA